MCGERARTRRSNSTAGREKSSARSSGPILGARETPPSGCGTGAARPAAISSMTSTSSGPPRSDNRAVSDPPSSSALTGTARAA